MSKLVKVRAIIEYDIEVPTDWGKKEIEFNRNDGCWCASNILDELRKIEERDGCLCDCTRFEVIDLDQPAP